MAEGGDFASIKDGSDADFDIVCNPCGEGYIREGAVKYCPECQEYLCTACTTYHGRLKTTRSHKLLDRFSAKQGSLVAVATQCLYHPDRDIEMYCKTHDMVYCLKCIATEHRTCSGVTGIEEIKTSSFQQMDMKRLQNDMKNTQERLQCTDKDSKNHLDCIEEQKVKILAEIEEVERSLLEHIHKLKRETKDTLNKDYALAKDELKSIITQIASMKKEIETASGQLQTIGSMDAGQQFVQMKLIQHTVTDAVKLVEDSEPKGSSALYFTEITDLKNSVITATSLGKMNTVRDKKQPTPRLYKVKSKKEVNVEMQHERRTCFISDVCQLQDGTIILADCDNLKIKMLDMNYTVKDHCDLDDSPSGICCTGQNEIAVKMNNNKVQFISADASFLKLKEKISIVGGDNWGMTYSAGKLWVSTGSSVNVYNISGTLLKTICRDTNNVKLFKSNTQHMIVSGETVIVADSSDGAVCLARDATVRTELRNSRLGNTKGVCVSNDGTVFLSGNSSNNIMMFDKNEKCLGELVTKIAGLVRPLSLHFDDRADCIIVTCVPSNKIIILNISD